MIEFIGRLIGYAIGLVAGGLFLIVCYAVVVWAFGVLGIG